MSRHPYTYSADLIRSFSPVGPNGVTLSRADAGQIREGLAEALGIDPHEFACKLSAYYQANEQAIGERFLSRFCKAADIPFTPGEHLVGDVSIPHHKV